MTLRPSVAYYPSSDAVHAAEGPVLPAKRVGGLGMTLKAPWWTDR